MYPPECYCVRRRNLPHLVELFDRSSDGYRLAIVRCRRLRCAMRRPVAPAANLGTCRASSRQNLTVAVAAASVRQPRIEREFAALSVNRARLAGSFQASQRAPVRPLPRTLNCLTAARISEGPLRPITRVSGPGGDTWLLLRVFTAPRGQLSPQLCNFILNQLPSSGRSVLREKHGPSQ
jgi:hypothetical protein